MSDAILENADAHWRPDTPELVRDMVAYAAAEETPVEVIGQGSKREIGRAVQARATLDLSHLTGLTLYEPDELVLSARAGTPLMEIEAALEDAGQALAFEPMDYGPLLGLPSGQDTVRGTLGGLLATNQSGPRRIAAGAARDAVLGVQAVSGRGEAFKSGGRVVKNVTGYDLSRGLANSWGTLAVLTELTFKVLPRPETQTTLILTGLEDRAAIAALAAAMGSANEVSGAAHLPHRVASRVAPVKAAASAVTALRLEGFSVSVDARADALATRLKDHGALQRLGPDDSAALWRSIRDAAPFAPDPETPAAARPQIWRCVLAPTDGPTFVRRMDGFADVEALYDWAGGLVWLAVPAHDDALADIVRAEVKALGGHATLIRATGEVRRTVPVFPPQEAGLAALSSRLKSQFDPHGVLNPGRMA